MTAPFEFDRRLTDWLEETAVPSTPDYLDELLDRTRRTRQRPAWASLERWLPVQLSIVRRPLVAVPRVAWGLLVLLLILVIALLAVSYAGRQRLPAPFGLAKTGIVTFDGGGRIYTANPDGSSVRQLKAGSDSYYSPTFALDGTRIAYWTAAGGCTTSLTTQMPNCIGPFTIQVMNADGSGVVTIDRDLVDTPDLTLSWAPDGKRFAYVKKVDGTSRIAIADTMSGTTALIGDPKIDAAGPQWAPGGDRIAFIGTSSSRQAAVYVMGASGDALTRVAPPDGPLQAAGVTWSPDGKALAFFAAVGTDNHDIWRVAPDGSGLVNLTQSATDEFFPVWSNAGTRIAYEEIDGPASVPQVNDVWVMTADGTAKTRLTTRNVTGAPLAWSPDDRELLGYEAGLANILVIAVDDARPQIPIPAPGNNYGNGSFQRLAP